MTSIADAVEQILGATKWSQKELANAVGVSSTTISDWRRGKTGSLQLANLIKVAALLGVSPSTFVEDLGYLPPGEKVKTPPAVSPKVTRLLAPLSHPEQERLLRLIEVGVQLLRSSENGSR